MRSAPAGPASSPAVRCAPSSKRLGVHDVVAKSIGSSNPYNMIRATFDALNNDAPKSVAQRRGKKVADLMAWRSNSSRSRSRGGTE